MARDLPYFKMYPKDFDTDENVRALSFSEAGLFLFCLNHAWINGGLPNDLEEIARLLKVESGEFAKLWARVGRCFHLDGSGRLVNGRQEEERAKAFAKSRKCAEATAAREGKRKVSIIGRSSDDHLRAYGFVSGSDSVSQEGGMGETHDSPPDTAPDLGIQLAPALDDSAKFQEAALAVGMGGSEMDWKKARWEWNALDIEQRLEAVKGLYRRKQVGEYDDPGFIPLPHNYLKNRMWERPIRPKARDSPKLTKNELAAQIFVENMIDDERKRQQNQNP